MFPQGFKAGGIHCGIAKSSAKKDLALFFSERPAVAAGMFTSNLVKAAPVLLCEKRLKSSAGNFRAVVANSGCANACTGRRGIDDAEKTCVAVAKSLGVLPSQVLAASTGVIGQFLPVSKLVRGAGELAQSFRGRKTVPQDAAQAIMTTDTVAKVFSKNINIGGRRVTLWGCTKGSGMIHPDLAGLHATMLCFILTDASIKSALLSRSLAEAVERSFNCVSVDGDTSTNDSVFVLANGASGSRTIDTPNKDYIVFAKALRELCTELAKMIARDGEGASKLIEIEVRNASTAVAAKKIASTIATSPLVKTAVFGNDANWGRILAAAGRAGVPMNPDQTDVYIGGLLVASRGMAVAFSEAKAKRLLKKKDVTITVDLNRGAESAKYYTCDLSFDYVKINASYRS